MLINIDPILSPEILHTLRSMGHGDKLILSDSNFPAYSMNSMVHRLDGVDAARAAKAARRPVQCIVNSTTLEHRWCFFGE